MDKIKTWEFLIETSNGDTRTMQVSGIKVSVYGIGDASTAVSVFDEDGDEVFGAFSGDGVKCWRLVSKNQQVSVIRGKRVKSVEAETE